MSRRNQALCLQHRSGAGGQELGCQFESSRIASGLALTWIHHIKNDTSFLHLSRVLRKGESTG